MREMNHPGFRRALIGDFLVRGEPALLHRLMGHLERATAGDLPGHGRPLIARKQLRATLAHTLHVLGGDLAGRNDGSVSSLYFMPGVKAPSGTPNIRQKRRLHDQETAGLVEHQQALQHVVQCGVEALALLLQSAGTTFALLGRLKQRMTPYVADRESDCRGYDQLKKNGHRTECASIRRARNQGSHPWYC